MERRWHSGEHGGHPGVSAEVRQQAVTCPRSNEQTIEHDEPDRLAGLQGGAREPIPFRAEAGDRPDVPLDARVLRLEVVIDLLQRRLGARIAAFGQDRDGPDRAPVGATEEGARLPPARRATDAAPLPLGAAHAASSGATTPPAAMTAPSLSTSRRPRMRVHVLSLVGRTGSTGQLLVDHASQPRWARRASMVRPVGFRSRVVMLQTIRASGRSPHGASHSYRVPRSSTVA